jgi:hypothetical protein
VAFLEQDFEDWMDGEDGFGDLYGFFWAVNLLANH